MGDAADVLVHGATGYTGRLVCAALARRGLAFDVSGRDAAKLDALARDVGAKGTRVLDARDGDGVRRAVQGHKVVCACAGPFLDVGEGVLATAARLGVHYVDTTGEQLFVARAVTRYRATAEASGACIVPSCAYEVAPADWAAHLAAEHVGGSPDGIDVLYAAKTGRGSTSRGTRRSALAQIGAGESMQRLGGTLVHELPAEVVRRFALSSGKELVAVSFPGPEAVLVPSHTKAREVRTFMAAGARAASVLHGARRLLPLAARVGAKLARDGAGRPVDGPSAASRETSAFEIVVEARRGPETATVRVQGRDPYGLTAEIQAYAAARLLLGAAARGVVAPSVAFDATRAFEALAPFGVRLL